MKSSKTKGYWKFNADLLNHDFCAYIKKIAEFKVKRMQSGIKWEYLKHKLSQYSITFSNTVANKVFKFYSKLYSSSFSSKIS